MKTIFISSTFRDMNEERDLFHERISPDLNEIARSYGESVSFCDLRWGVDTTTLESEDGSRKVLSVCFDEIDRCRPYMIVLLGERYGWIPDGELIAQTIKGRRGFALDELERSVTALEIEYGALRNSDQLDRTLFYFRELEGNPASDYCSEDASHAAKLADLKQRIMELAGGNVKTYRARWDEENDCVSDLSDFAAMVTEDLRELLENEWKEMAKLTPFQKDVRGQWEYARQKAAQFSARDDLIRQYTHLIQGEQNCFAIQGPSGSGKSTLMSKLAMQLVEDREVLPIFSSSTMMCGTAMDIVKYIVEYLENALELPHFAEQKHEQAPGLREWRQKLTELVDSYDQSGRKPLVILVDAVDQLLANEERDNLCFLPENLSQKVKLVFSCLDSFHIRSGIHIETVPSLEDADRELIIRGILASTGRDLSAEVIHAMAAREGADTPLYLSLLVTRLEMMDRDDFEQIVHSGAGMDAINAHQIHIINACPPGLDELCVEILREASAKLGSDLPFVASEFLAASRYGLRERDLEGIVRQLEMPWDSLSFAMFYKYMRRFFIQRDDGRIDFAHQTFRKGFLNRLEDAKFYHAVLVKHFESLDKKDGVRIREVLYHYIQADDKVGFVKFCDKICLSGEPNALAVIRQQCQRDSGTWLRSLLREGETYGAGIYMIILITFHFESAFVQSASDQKILLAVLEETAGLSRRLLPATEKRFFKLIMYNSISNVAKICQRLGGIDNQRRALEINLEVLELENAFDGGTGISDLPESYVAVGRSYLALGTAQDLQRAMDMFQKARGLMEKKLKRELNVNNRYDVAVVYNELGSLCRTLGNIEDAVHWCQEAMKILEELASGDLDEKIKIKILSELANSYNCTGHIFMEQKEKHQERALDYYRKALAVFERIDRLNQTIESKDDVISSCQLVCNVYISIGGEENLNKALEIQKRIVAEREHINQELNSVRSRNLLSLTYEFLASIYLELGGQQNLENALTAQNRSVEISKALMEDTRTADAQNRYASAMCNAARIYQKLGGEDGLKLSLDLLGDALEIFEQVSSTQKTVESFKYLLIALIQVVRHPLFDAFLAYGYWSRVLEISRILFDRTNDPMYEKLIQEAEQKLNEVQ